MKNTHSYPARQDSRLLESSATNTPMKTVANGSSKDPAQEKSHEHRWVVFSQHWRCNDCGMTYG